MLLTFIVTVAIIVIIVSALGSLAIGLAVVTDKSARDRHTAAIDRAARAAARTGLPPPRRYSPQGARID
jgi:hypothetical protein